MTSYPIILCLSSENGDLINGVERVQLFLPELVPMRFHWLVRESRSRSFSNLAFSPDLSFCFSQKSLVHDFVHVGEWVHDWFRIMVGLESFRARTITRFGFSGGLRQFSSSLALTGTHHRFWELTFLNQGFAPSLNFHRHWMRSQSDTHA